MLWQFLITLDCSSLNTIYIFFIFAKCFLCLQGNIYSHTHIGFWTRVSMLIQAQSPCCLPIDHTPMGSPSISYDEGKFMHNFTVKSCNVIFFLLWENVKYFISKFKLKVPNPSIHSDPKWCWCFRIVYLKLGFEYVFTNRHLYNFHIIMFFCQKITSQIYLAQIR